MLASAITRRAQQRSAKAASDPKTPVPQKMPNKNLKTNVREGGNHPEKKKDTHFKHVMLWMDQKCVLCRKEQLILGSGP